MAVKRVNSRLEFILQITDYFKGHWEDPEWGRRPANQVLIALAVRELAQGIQDAAAQKTDLPRSRTRQSPRMPRQYGKSLV